MFLPYDRKLQPVETTIETATLETVFKFNSLQFKVILMSIPLSKIVFLTLFQTNLPSRKENIERNVQYQRYSYLKIHGF